MEENINNENLPVIPRSSQPTVKEDKKIKRIQINIDDEKSKERYKQIAQSNKLNQTELILNFMDNYDLLKPIADAKGIPVFDLISYYITNDEKIQRLDELSQKYGEIESQLSKKEEENIKLQTKINELENDRFADLIKRVKELENFSSIVKEHAYFYKMIEGKSKYCLYAQLESSE